MRNYCAGSRRSYARAVQVALGAQRPMLAGGGLRGAAPGRRLLVAPMDGAGSRHWRRTVWREARKPVIDDEPLGAGARFEPGRRDADPEKSAPPPSPAA